MVQFGNVSMIFSYLVEDTKNPTIRLLYGGEGYRDRGICEV